MYAIVQIGGKQYRIEKGDEIEVELFDADEKTISFEEILLINDGKLTMVGTPHLAQYRVMGEILREVKGDKTTSFTYKRRKGYRRKVGHRQRYSRVKITEIDKKGE